VSIKAVLFDLDGTLLPMNQDLFVKDYFSLLAARLAPLGYEPEQLIGSIWAGTKAMVKNDGARTNEERFWEVFASVFGEQALKDKSVIDDFYSKEFAGAKKTCGFAPQAKEIVDGLKEKGKSIVLATNPIFPAVATENRIRWAGLSPDDFVLYTTYENSCHSKPNPAYYVDILQKIGLCSEECLMVGNDVAEDMVAQRLGMQVFLLTDCLINKNNEDISHYPHGDFAALKEFLSGI